jgi:hypothetical protein
MPGSNRDYENYQSYADVSRAQAASQPVEHESFHLAYGQVSALQAVAAAIERLAQAVENLAEQGRA